MKENFDYSLLVTSLLNAMEYIQEATGLDMYEIETEILGLEVNTYLELLEEVK